MTKRMVSDVDQFVEILLYFRRTRGIINSNQDLVNRDLMKWGIGLCS